MLCPEISPRPWGWRRVSGPPNLRTHNFLPEDPGVPVPAPDTVARASAEDARRMALRLGAQVPWYPGPLEPGMCSIRY